MHIPTDYELPNLIVVEGPDGGGKRTQSVKLVQRLNQEGYKALYVSFPNYDNPSSTLVKKYLKGDYPESKEEDNIIFVQQISSFYAVDRVSSFIEPIHDTVQKGKSLIEMLDEGWILVCDRYTTSNIMHQSANITRKTHIESYINWVTQLEFGDLGLPEPYKTIFLDVPPEVSIENLKKRYNGEKKEDLLENINHQTSLHEVKDRVINHCGWDRVICTEDGEMLSVDVIHEEIYSRLDSFLKRYKG